jgi:hypothetical protein
VTSQNSIKTVTMTITIDVRSKNVTFSNVTST